MVCVVANETWPSHRGEQGYWAAQMKQHMKTDPLLSDWNPRLGYVARLSGKIPRFAREDRELLELTGDVNNPRSYHKIASTIIVLTTKRCYPNHVNKPFRTSRWSKGRTEYEEMKFAWGPCNRAQNIQFNGAEPRFGQK